MLTSGPAQLLYFRVIDFPRQLLSRLKRARRSPPQRVLNMGHDRLAALRVRPVSTRQPPRHATLATHTTPRPRDRPMPRQPPSKCSASVHSLPTAPRMTRIHRLRIHLPWLHSMLRCAFFHCCYVPSCRPHLQTTAIEQSIAEFNANVTAITDLHAHSMNALSDQDSAANHSRLAELTESTRALSNALSNRIKALKVNAGGASTRDAEIRKNRVCLTVRIAMVSLKQEIIVDYIGTRKIRRDTTEIPECRAAVSAEIQGSCGTTVQDR